LITFDSLSLFGITNMAKAAPDRNAFIPTADVVELLRAEDIVVGFVDADEAVRCALLAYGLVVDPEAILTYGGESFDFGFSDRPKAKNIVHIALDIALGARPLTVSLDDVPPAILLWVQRCAMDAAPEAFVMIVADALAERTESDRAAVLLKCFTERDA
jgi:hypothetical protein